MVRRIEVTASGITTPRAIFAPVDMPFDLELLDGLGEDVMTRVVVDGVNVDVGEAIAEVFDGATGLNSGLVVEDPSSFKI